MFTTVHSVLQIVLEKLLLAGGILAKGGNLAAGVAALQPWQVLTRRFPELRSQEDGHGAPCRPAAPPPAPATTCPLFFNAWLAGGEWRVKLAALACRGAEIASFLVHNGHGCFAASLLPASALQTFLGYNETRGIKFVRNQLFTDFWMTVAQASQEVDRLLGLARRHAEVAVSGLHSAGLRDEAAVMVWMRKYGRNEGERARLQQMLDRMGVGVGK